MRVRLIVIGLILGIGAVLLWSRSSEANPDQELMRAIASTGINQTGWQQIDDAAWYSLAMDACEQGAWDDDISESLAGEFMATHGIGGADQTGELQMTIWQIMHQACIDQVPEGANPPLPVDQ